MDYLKKVEKDLGGLTDSKYSASRKLGTLPPQIFGGTFIIDSVEQESSLSR